MKTDNKVFKNMINTFLLKQLTICFLFYFYWLIESKWQRQRKWYIHDNKTDAVLWKRIKCPYKKHLGMQKLALLLVKVSVDYVNRMMWSTSKRKFKMLTHQCRRRNNSVSGIWLLLLNDDKYTYIHIYRYHK